MLGLLRGARGLRGGKLSQRVRSCSRERRVQPVSDRRRLPRGLRRLQRVDDGPALIENVMQGLARAAVALALTLHAPLARAAGYDTPILYTARHQGMGGTAIAYVDDPSATFHNPAGLAGVKGLAAIGDLSLILGKVRSTPDRAVGSVESEPVLAPFFLLGAGYRVHEWVSVGLGF